MAQKNPLDPIPHPPRTLVLGNLLSLGISTPIQDMMTLARQYGPIYWLDMMGKPIVVVSGFSLIDELCDETRFDKSVKGALRRLRAFAGDGLHTPYTPEPHWALAHNTLLPNFGQKAMQGYHPMMVDIAEQLAHKWERLNADDEIDVTHDMTSLTLDTIGLCGFGYRFNSFYRDTNHPFVSAMIGALGASMETRGFPLESFIKKDRERQLRADIRYMNEMVDRIIQERRQGQEPRQDGDDVAGKPDLLSCMLSGVDRKSGERLDDLNIRYQVITFLIAGHETTSGLLSFAVYFLLQNPEVLARAYEEVDRVLGPDPSVPPTYAQVNQLAYLDQVLKESLRLWPTAPVFALSPHKETMIGGAYRMKKPYQIVVLTPMLHRDPSVWGERADVFDPDHFSREAERGRPGNAYKPFGNGQRACIGRQFALQEAALVLGMVLQRFKLIDHTRYRLRLKETLTLKPDGFRIKVRRRTDRDRARPAARAASRSTDAPASYNGTPPDNAARFCEWLRAADPATTPLAGVRYTVFGCGNRDWVSTFQAIPRLIDERLAALGAARLYGRGEGDAREDFDGQFQAWHEPLGATLAKALGVELAAAEAAEASHLTVETMEGGDASPFVDSLGARAMRIAVNRELHTKTGPDASPRSTRHLELELPEGVAYRAGDHLGVIPRNVDATVRRVAARFGLDPAASVRLRLGASRKTFLPVDQPIRVGQLLGDYVELQDPATRRQIQELAAHTECPWTRPRLLAIASDEGRFREEVLARRKSLIDLLEEFPAGQLPFNRYLEMLPPLRPRYYSISSSPLQDERRCSVTVAVVDGPARSGRGSFQGVCSSYLLRQPEGGQIHAFVKDTKSAFRLPADPATPIIMIGPGTGLAPFRGFLQERAARRAAGRTVGPALLFFGCRHPRQDFIYEDELRGFAEQGVARLFACFSRLADEQKTYVQDQVLRQRAEVWQLLQAGAVVYVCGDASRMAPDVRRAFAAIHRHETGGDERAAEVWLDGLTAENRYLVDVWAS